MTPAPGPETLAAYAHCASVVRRSGSSFAAAFWMFGREERRALHALYAFCRLADDIADSPEIAGDRARLLARWRSELRDAFRGKATHPVGIALGDAARRFELEEAVLSELLRGIESDLAGAPIETWDELRRYCYRVASTVGLCVVRLRGARQPQTAEYAEELGIAVQLTNVLRDVGADAAAGRIYLPRQELAHLGIPPESLAAREPSDEIRLLCAQTAERARLHYERAAALLPEGDRPRLRPAQAMGGIYRALLDELHARGFPCLGAPIRISRPRRLAIAARAWLGFGGPA